MQIYRCDLVLHDYLFFATTERGKVAETGPFIHNYALTYALGWATSPWYNEIQQPRYHEQLARVEKRYVTPATLMRGSYLTTQYNTMSESYRLTKIQSAGYPDWGFIKCFRPGSAFRFYVLSAQIVQFPHYLRLGKFMTKAALLVAPSSSLQTRLGAFNERETRQQGIIHPLLTWNDLPNAARPVVYDIIANALPSRLIEHAVFTGVEGPYFAATFDGEAVLVELPARMGYYGEQLCSSW
ncbi:MAG TPA: type I-D CRISPR-associated protein Cas5/Csc1 [Ktedonobacteraceae bacterium]|nr:type I-D CRISPR-associated protein Cas5/Csc1 [Ktedonobacteraceae bacterium]